MDIADGKEPDARAFHLMHSKSKQICTDIRKRTKKEVQEIEKREKTY